MGGSQACACVVSNRMTQLSGFGPQFTNTARPEVQSDALVIMAPVSPGRGGSEAPMCF